MTNPNQGEGNYEAAKEFQDAQHAFAKSGKVPAKAREAADALEGEGAAELEAARQAAADSKSA